MNFHASFYLLIQFELVACIEITQHSSRDGKEREEGGLKNGYITSTGLKQ